MSRLLRRATRVKSGTERFRFEITIKKVYLTPFGVEFPDYSLVSSIGSSLISVCFVRRNKIDITSEVRIEGNIAEWNQVLSRNVTMYKNKRNEWMPKSAKLVLRVSTWSRSKGVVHKEIGVVNLDLAEYLLNSPLTEIPLQCRSRERSTNHPILFVTIVPTSLAPGDDDTMSIQSELSSRRESICTSEFGDGESVEGLHEEMVQIHVEKEEKDENTYIGGSTEENEECDDANYNKEEKPQELLEVDDAEQEKEDENEDENEENEENEDENENTTDDQEIVLYDPLSKEDAWENQSNDTVVEIDTEEKEVTEIIDQDHTEFERTKLEGVNTISEKDNNYDVGKSELEQTLAETRQIVAVQDDRIMKLENQVVVLEQELQRANEKIEQKVQTELLLKKSLEEEQKQNATKSEKLILLEDELFRAKQAAEMNQNDLKAQIAELEDELISLRQEIQDSTNQSKSSRLSIDAPSFTLVTPNRWKGDASGVPLDDVEEENEDQADRVDKVDTKYTEEIEQLRISLSQVEKYKDELESLLIMAKLEAAQAITELEECKMQLRQMSKK